MTSFGLLNDGTGAIYSLDDKIKFEKLKLYVIYGKCAVATIYELGLEQFGRCYIFLKQNYSFEQKAVDKKQSSILK